MKTARTAQASPARKIAFAAVVAVSLCGCGSTPPGASQSLVLQAPVITTTWYADSDGPHIRLDATVDSHGARVREMHVLIAREDGRPTPDAPTVTAAGPGVVVETTNQTAGVTVVRFAPPGVADGTIVTLDVEAAAGAPSPFRIRVTPVFVDPSLLSPRPESAPAGS